MTEQRLSKEAAPYNVISFNSVTQGKDTCKHCRLSRHMWWMKLLININRHCWAVKFSAQQVERNWVVCCRRHKHADNGEILDISYVSGDFALFGIDFNTTANACFLFWENQSSEFNCSSRKKKKIFVEHIEVGRTKSVVKSFSIFIFVNYNMLLLN